MKRRVESNWPISLGLLNTHHQLRRLEAVFLGREFFLRVDFLRWELDRLAARGGERFVVELLGGSFFLFGCNRIRIKDPKRMRVKKG